MVVRLYNNYIVKIGNAMAASGEVVEGVYEGEYNAAGERRAMARCGLPTATCTRGSGRDEVEGRGTMRYADGDVYEGEWKADKKEGRGTYRFANGTGGV